MHTYPHYIHAHTLGRLELVQSVGVAVNGGGCGNDHDAKARRRRVVSVRIRPVSAPLDTGLWTLAVCKDIYTLTGG